MGRGSWSSPRARGRAPPPAGFRRPAGRPPAAALSGDVPSAGRFAAWLRFGSAVGLIPSQQQGSFWAGRAALPRGFPAPKLWSAGTAEAGASDTRSCHPHCCCGDFAPGRETRRWLLESPSQERRPPCHGLVAVVTRGGG